MRIIKTCPWCNHKLSNKAVNEDYCNHCEESLDGEYLMREVDDLDHLNDTCFNQ